MMEVGKPYGAWQTTEINVETEEHRQGCVIYHPGARAESGPSTDPCSKLGLHQGFG